METLRKNKYWNLFLALISLLYGGVRIYQHYNGYLTLSAFRLVIAVAFIGFGFYYLYLFFKVIKKTE